MTIKIYEALDIINIHVSEGVEIAPNQLYRIDEKYIKLNDLRETDKLSVEKLQEHLFPYKKEMVQKIIDEKMQLVTVDEFVKLQKESLTAIRENDKLKEQIDTVKKALIEIAEIINGDIHKCDYGCDNNCELNGSLNIYSVENVQSVIDSALAEIGGDDE